MISFRGVKLDNIPSLMIEDIRVSPIALNPVTRQRAIQPGADFVRMTQGTRTVSVTFGLLKMDKYARRQLIEDITRWARSEQPEQLTVQNYPGKAIDAICTGLPEPSTRQWWENRLRITFTAFDPFFYSIDEKSASCGAAFYVGGDAPPKMRIERTLSASASSQTYSDGNNSMTFSTIPAGNLVIDLNRQTAAVGTTNIMQYFTFGSHFPKPKTGSMTITGTGTIKYRERWE